MKISLSLLMLFMVLTSATCKNKKQLEATENVTMNQQSALLDSHWFLESMTLAGKEIPLLDATLDIKKNTITGKGGCNSYRSSYTLQNRRLVISNIGATKKYCGNASKFEAMYFKALQATTGYQLADKLTLTGPTSQLVFTSKPPSVGTPKELVGNWLLIRIEEGEKKIPFPSNITIKFDAKKVNGNGGCNRFFANYTAHKNDLKISDMGATEMYCEDKSPFEDQYFKYLETTESFRVTKAKLELITPTAILTFREKRKNK